jgi:hypothetical protein
MNGLLQDLRYALRQLRKSRGFTIIAVVTLALGIGANTAIFSVVNGVLLSPLPFPNSGRIVSLFQDKPNFPKGAISYPNFLDWQRDNRSFEALAAYRWGDGSITGIGQAEDVHAQRISCTFFPILSVNPILGRNFRPDEDRRGANPTVMISEGLWKRKFGSDRNVIGKRLIVAGEGRTIIGVIPSSFGLTIQNFRAADVYEPIGEETNPVFHKRDSFWGMDAIGLLKPGVTAQQAREDMKRVNAGLATAYPDVNANIKSTISTLKDEIVGDSRPVLLVLLGAVAAVPRSSFTSTLPRAEAIGLDLRVLLFTLFVSVITGIAFGLLPALRSFHRNIGETLKDAGRTVSGSRSRVQKVFVIGEMAMALVLLVGAGLMLRTLMQLWRVDPGFDPHHVINFGITPASSLPDQSPEAIRAVLRQLHSTVHEVPGVDAVSLHWGANPMQGDTETTFLAEGQPAPARKADLPFALDYIVEPEYLTAMRIPLLRGRFISDSDNEHSNRIAVIDSSFAEEYFAGQDPIGKHVSIFDFDSDLTQRAWMQLTVVGVVGHVSQFGLSDDPLRPLHAQLFRPLMQGPNRVMQDVAHGMGAYVRFKSPLNAEALFQTIRKKLTNDNDQIIVSGNESEDEVVARSIASQRFALFLLGSFALLALLLASIGIYGVLSYLVGQRTQEIGVRMALGAQRLDVLRMVLKDGTRMMLAGVAIGIVTALALTQLMASMLFGVKPTDPVTFGAVAALLCGIALFACYLPARKAMRVDPMVALRYE